MYSKILYTMTLSRTIQILIKKGETWSKDNPKPEVVKESPKNLLCYVGTSKIQKNMDSYDTVHLFFSQPNTIIISTSGYIVFNTSRKPSVSRCNQSLQNWNEGTKYTQVTFWVTVEGRLTNFDVHYFIQNGTTVLIGRVYGRKTRVELRVTWKIWFSF